MPDKQQAIRDALQAALRDGFVAASLVTRDGINVQTTDSRVGSPETFAAMSAALVGAAEAALFERGVIDAVRVVAHTPTGSLVAVGVSDDLLLVLLAEKTKSLGELQTNADAIGNKVRVAVAGARP